MTLFDEAVLARLPFGSPDAPGTQGQLLLFADGTLQMVPSYETVAEFESFTGGIREKAVAWGSSLIVGLGAVGGLLWLKGKRGAAWGAFGASGIAGILSGAARRQAGEINHSLLARHRIGETASVRSSRTGGIIFSVREPNLPPWSVTLGPGDFDPADAAEFLRHFEGR
ncbi:MAG: hypothetical protein V4671_08475 [Armatimonadota bacterium]